MLIGFSEDSARPITRSSFLREQVYKHYKVRRMTSKAPHRSCLFDAFFNETALMPRSIGYGATLGSGTGAAGRHARGDYIAGMTDRYAILEHARLFDPRERT